MNGWTDLTHLGTRFPVCLATSTAAQPMRMSKNIRDSSVGQQRTETDARNAEFFTASAVKYWEMVASWQRWPDGIKIFRTCGLACNNEYSTFCHCENQGEKVPVLLKKAMGQRTFNEKWNTVLGKNAGDFDTICFPQTAMMMTSSFRKTAGLSTVCHRY